MFSRMLPYFHTCPKTLSKTLILFRDNFDPDVLFFDNHLLTIHSIEDTPKPQYFMIAQRYVRGTDEETIIWLLKKEFDYLKKKMHTHENDLFRDAVKAFNNAYMQEMVKRMIRGELIIT